MTLTGGPQTQGGGAPQNPYAGNWTTASLDQAGRAQTRTPGWTTETLQQAAQAQLQTPAAVATQQTLAQNPLLAAGLQNIGTAQQDIWGQILATQGQYGQQQQFAQQDYNLAMQGLGLDQAGLGINRAELDLRAQDLAASLGFVDRREGISDETLTNQLARLGISQEAAKGQNATQIRAIENRATAGGAWFSPEKRLASEDSNAALDQTLRDIAIQQSDAQLSNDLAQVGFDEDRQQIGSQQQGITLQGQSLDLAAQQMGLSSQQLQNQLAQQLSNMGIQQAQQIAGLFASGTQLTGEQGALLQELANMAWQNMSYNQSLPTNLTPNPPGFNQRYPSRSPRWTRDNLEQAQAAQSSAPTMWG